MPDSLTEYDFPVDYEAVLRQEIEATVTAAVAALASGQQPATDTPLRRQVGRAAESTWRRRQLAQMRARTIRGKLAAMRRRVQH